VDIPKDCKPPDPKLKLSEKQGLGAEGLRGNERQLHSSQRCEGRDTPGAGLLIREVHKAQSGELILCESLLPEISRVMAIVREQMVRDGAFDRAQCVVCVCV